MTGQEALPPTINFTTHPSVSSFNTPPQMYISSQPEKPNYTVIITGALVFDAASPSRILLVQRAGHDSMPHKWENPGGGCDPEDPSILYSTARELWEETGLTTASIGPRVGAGHIFSSPSGTRACRLNFIVQPETGEAGQLDVKLNPNEHEAFVWATEDDVKLRKSGQVELDFTSPEAERAILEAFTLKTEIMFRAH